MISIAHSSLGYKCLSASSYGKNSPRFQDSIDAAWRSASHLSITDIPDFLSPSPKLQGQKRSKSEADLSGCKVKDEPLTPRSSPLGPSATGRVEAAKRKYTEIASRRLRDVMEKEKGMTHESGTEIPPVGYLPTTTATAAAADQIIQSKRRRLTASAGLSLSVMPFKEKVQLVELQGLTSLITTAGQSPEEPLTKRLSEASGIAATTMRQKARNSDVQRWGKPLSLKSRIKLAMRQAGKVS